MQKGVRQGFHPFSHPSRRKATALLSLRTFSTITETLPQYDTDMNIKDLAGLSKPVCKLIDALKTAGFGIAKPSQIRRVAQAEADAKLTHAYADAAVESVAVRARQRIADEEIRRQQNIDAIADRALSSLPSVASDSPVDPDWITHFLNESKDTSNREVQELWGRLLAGEIATPDTFSRRTVSMVKLLDSSDAKLFTQLCQLSLSNELLLVDGRSPFVSKTLNLTFDSLLRLQSCGLIVFDSSDRAFAQIFASGDESKVATFEYFDECVFVDRTSAIPLSGNRYALNVGNVCFTREGKELNTLVDRRKDARILEYAVKSLSRLNGDRSYRFWHGPPGTPIPPHMVDLLNDLPQMPDVTPADSLGGV